MTKWMPDPPNGKGRARRVRVVRSIKLQNVEADHVTMLLLGDTEPELAAALSIPEARQLAAALLDHAGALERDAPRIIVPPTP